MKRKKGFTLIELIIVLAIIAVFSAVLVPSWMTYIRKTRLKTADGRARTIFNAAQTVALKYQATERNASSAYLSNGDFITAGRTERAISATQAGTPTAALLTTRMQLSDR